MSAKRGEPITDFERQIITTVSRATFIPGTGPKRFIRDCYSGHIKQLTEKGRWYLAFIAHRFRKQYALTAEQMAWVTEQLNNQPGLWKVPR